MESDSRVLIDKIPEPSQVEVESDSKVLQQCISVESTFTTLICKCRDLIQRNWKVRFIHTYKEGNKVVDWLASKGIQNGIGSAVYANAPPDLIPILLNDAMDVSTPRNVGK